MSNHSQFATCRAQQARQHLLWYMEKERNWFLNIWYISPSGLGREDAGWGV